MPASPVLPCSACPLRSLPLFVAHDADELALVQSLKQRELRTPAGHTLIHEGQTDAPLYTLLDGWAFRFKTLSDGRRQILNILLAGDFIGVQQKMGDGAAHGVVTLTEAVFCVFQRDALWAMHRLHRIEDGRLHLRDPKALARLADLYGDGRPAPRPLV